MTATAGPLRAALYLRVSSDEQRDNYSLPHQEREGRAYIAAQGWTLEPAHIFKEVYSGAYLGRTELDRLREVIDRRGIDHIVVYHSDRFGRDPDDRIFLRVEARQRGVQYVSVTDPMGDRPEDRLIDYVAGYAAAMERRSFARRSQAGLRSRVASGKRLVGPKAPFGYRWTTDVDAKGKPIRSGLVVNEPEAAIVRRIFREVAAGASMRSVAASLNRDAVPTPNPARCKPGHRPTWYIKTIHDLMSNPVYLGRSVAYRQESRLVDEHTGRRVARIKPEAEWQAIPGSTVPALVDAATWERAQARRAVNQERSSRSKTDHKDALLRGGMVRCAYCDTTLHVHRKTNGRQRVFYRCDHKHPKPGCRAEGRAFGTQIEVHILDREVWTSVEAILSNPGVIRARLRAMVGEDTTAQELVDLRALLTDLDRQEANLAEAIAQAGSPVAITALTRKLEAIAEQRSAAKQQEADARLRHWARQAALKQADDLAAWCARERAALAGLDYDAKRERLERLGVRVHVYRPGAFEGRWELTLQPQDFTLQDARAGQPFPETAEHTA